MNEDNNIPKNYLLLRHIVDTIVHYILLSIFFLSLGFLSLYFLIDIYSLLVFSILFIILLLFITLSFLLRITSKYKHSNLKHSLSFSKKSGKTRFIRALVFGILTLLILVIFNFIESQLYSFYIICLLLGIFFLLSNDILKDLDQVIGIYFIIFAIFALFFQYKGIAVNYVYAVISFGNSTILIGVSIIRLKHLSYELKK